MADDRLAFHQHRGLPGRGAGELLAERDLERLVAAAAGVADAGRQGARVVAEPDRVDAGAVAVQDGVADPHAARLQLLAGADRDGVGGGVGGEHVERLRRGDADAAALADGEVVVAAVAADRAPGAVEDGAGGVAKTAVAAQEPALALAGEEAEVLALGLARDRQPVAGGDLPHLGLGQLGEREAKPAEQLGRQRRQHVALVLGAVGGGGEQRAVGVLDDPRVVAGQQVRGAEPLGEVDHRRDPDLAVAEHAGVGGAAGGVAGDEAADDAAAEFLLEVEREVRDAERVGEPAGAEHRLRRAAGLGAVGLRVGPELDRDADHLGAALARQQRRDGAVDASRHGDGDALGAGASVGPGRGRVPGKRQRKAEVGCGSRGERPVQGVGGELGGVALGRRETADRLVDFVDPELRRLQDRRPVDDLGDRRGRGTSRPASLGVEADRGDPLVLDRHRDPREVPARRSTGRSGEGALGHRPAPARRRRGNAQKAPSA